MRVENAFETRDTLHYPGLLTSDFRYTFSASSDPNLVDLYPNWDLEDEVESTKHLFEGFVNSTGQAIPAAKSIALVFSGVQYVPDPTHPDSLQHYAKVVLTQVDGTFRIGSAPDSVVYTIKGRHELFVVRGDAAVIGADQEAIPGRWYLRRWDDLSQPEYGFRSASTTLATWGAIRASYR